MSKILVCGLVNIETTVKAGSFPIEYCPIDYNFFGVNSAVSGVGVNLSLALSALDDEVFLLSYVGDDVASFAVIKTLADNNISCDYLQKCDSTPQSVVMFDDNGRRKIYCDLKDMQDKSYDEEVFEKAARDCDMLCLCNINFSRNLLKIAKKLNKSVACDVHVLSDINDDYNRDFISNSEVLFLSNEGILGKEHEFITSLKNRYDNRVIVIGMGEKGSMMYTRDNDDIFICPAVHTREIINTVGAGDALFSAFVHFYSKGEKPEKALQLATCFASYKIGENGASKGFLDEQKLFDLSLTL